MILFLILSGIHSIFSIKNCELSLIIIHLSLNISFFIRIMHREGCMEVIQIGSLAILPKWVLLGAAIILGLLFINIWLRRSQQKKVFDLLSNSVFLGFFIWKGSLLLLDPVLVWKSPFSLLYFSGGNDGLIIAIICSGIYFILQSRKINISNILACQSIFLFSFAVLAVYHVLFVVFLGTDRMYHLIVGAFSILILIVGFLKEHILYRRGMISATILFSFIQLILLFVLFKTNHRAFIFSLEQWFFIGLIIFLLFIDKGSKQSKE